MSRLLVLIALVLAALALVAAGCGDDDDDGGDETEQSATTGSGFSTEGDDEDASDIGDTDAKIAVRSAVPAIEVYATDHDGVYDGATVETLQGIEPTLPDDLELTFPSPASYEVSLPAESGVTYTASKNEDGAMVLTCEPAGEGLCDESGEW